MNVIYQSQFMRVCDAIYVNMACGKQIDASKIVVDEGLLAMISLVLGESWPLYGSEILHSCKYISMDKSVAIRRHTILSLLIHEAFYFDNLTGMVLNLSISHT